MTRPFVSVIVPVRNEERHIERCLYSIASQDYPRDRIEVIVIDGQSDDGTRAIVTRFAHESTIDLRLFENPRRKPAAAMNIGIDAARGDVIVRVDGHAALAPDYVRRCIDALDDPAIDCAGGALASEGDTYVGRAIALAMSSRFGVGGAAFRVGGGGAVDTVAFGAYRRDVFDRIGLFAEDIDRGEDDEFNYRLRDAGGTIVLVPEARASYTVRGDLPGLWRQYLGYGRAKPQVLSRHPAQVQLRQLAPPALVMALGGAAIFALAGRWWPLRTVVAVYAAVTTMAAVVVVSRRGWHRLPVLPAAFACLHVSYGLGFLLGVLDVAAARLSSKRPGEAARRDAPKK